jgi:hypothetical protein
MHVKKKTDTKECLFVVISLVIMFSSGIINRLNNDATIKFICLIGLIAGIIFLFYSIRPFESHLISDMKKEDKDK